jgi:sporulation protein YlmC with PRC-barrel domain
MKSLPIISLQTGEAVGWTKQAVFDIAALEIQAFECQSAAGNRSVVLMTRDIRQLASDCVIIDSEDELADPKDIVRLRAILKANFNPLGKSVVSDSGRKLGSVEDFTINLETTRVQKLHVRQSLIQAWLGGSLIIDRTQIIDITPRQITVREATLKSPLIPEGPVPEVPS